MSVSRQREHSPAWHLPRGSPFVAGFFQGSVDFGTGVNEPKVSAGGSDTWFVWKLDANGTPIWSDAVGNGRAWSIASDGTNALVTAGSSIVKLDASGGLVWTTAISTGTGNGITVDATANVYTIGEFGGGSVTADFDPGPGSAYLTTGLGSDAFVLKLDSSGTFLSARQMSADGSVRGLGIAVDSSNNIVTVGDFRAMAYFDIGTTTQQRTSNQGSPNIFVVQTTQGTPTTPQLASLSDSPDPATKNGPLTLTASDVRVVAGGSNVASVSLYRDKNGNGTLRRR